MREVMAVNFEFSPSATLRKYVSDPAPKSLLSENDVNEKISSLLRYGSGLAVSLCLHPL